MENMKIKKELERLEYIREKLRNKLNNGNCKEVEKEYIKRNLMEISIKKCRLKKLLNM